MGLDAWAESEHTASGQEPRGAVVGDGPLRYNPEERVDVKERDLALDPRHRGRLADDPQRAVGRIPRHPQQARRTHPVGDRRHLDRAMAVVAVQTFNGRDPEGLTVDREVGGVVQRQPFRRSEGGDDCP